MALRVKGSLLLHTNISLCGSASLLYRHEYGLGGGHCAIGLPAPPEGILAEPIPHSATPFIGPTHGSVTAPWFASGNKL